MWWLWNSSRYRDEVAVTNQPDPQDPLLRATEDEQFLEAPVLGKEFRADSLVSTDPWRVLRIMGEFVEGFDRLADVTDGVSFFGSARTPEDHPHYVAAVETARLQPVQKLEEAVCRNKLYERGRLGIILCALYRLLNTAR